MQEGFFHFVLSEYPNQSHNFTSLNFCDVTILFSLSQLSELDDFISFPSYGCNLETERERERESDTDLSTTDMMYAQK